MCDALFDTPPHRPRESNARTTHNDPTSHDANEVSRDMDLDEKPSKSSESRPNGRHGRGKGQKRAQVASFNKAERAAAKQAGIEEAARKKEEAARRKAEIAKRKAEAKAKPKRQKGTQ